MEGGFGAEEVDGVVGGGLTGGREFSRGSSGGLKLLSGTWKEKRGRRKEGEMGRERKGSTKLIDSRSRSR